MNIERIVCGALEANCYIIYQKDGGSAYIIDPGYDIRQTQDFVNAHRLHVEAILLTHAHYDHAGKADTLADYFDVEVCAGREEIEHYKGKPSKLVSSNIGRLFEGGEILDLDGESVEVLYTPGHTSGGLCFYSARSKAAFTGDTIFDVDLSYTHFPGGSAARMKESLKIIVNKWGNDVRIYPGHGDSALMKHVRKVNTEFLEMIAE